jgi:hypothetical protein
MWTSAELLAGLLDRGGDAYVSAEDFDGPAGPAVRAWLRAGFLGRESWPDPAPVCPHCGDGVPYRAGSRLLCNRCLSPVGPRWLRRWRLDDAAVLGWLAAALALRGSPQQLGPVLWQLGTAEMSGDPCEVFFRRPGPLSRAEHQRFLAYRIVYVLFGHTPPPAGECGGEVRSLLDLLQDSLPLAVRPLAGLRPSGEDVQFDAGTGVLWVGTRRLGEVPVGSKEHAFLQRLAAEADHFVPYRDLKRAVLRETGSCDTADEATLCHKLKSRIKRRFIPEIQRLLVTSNKGDGYRLRGQREAVG